MAPSPLYSRRNSQPRPTPATMVGKVGTLKDPPPSIKASSTATQDAASVAMSEASSHISESWHCPHCGYKNGDLKQEKCAVCGIKDQRHVEDYRQVIQRQQPPGGTGSYRWFSSSDNGNNHSSNTSPTNSHPIVPPVKSVATRVPAYTSPPPLASTIHVSHDQQDTKQDGYPPSSNSSSIYGTERVTTPYVDTKCQQRQKIEGFRGVTESDNVIVSPASTSKTRPGRHGSFHDDVPSPPKPNKRPPRSPKASIAGASMASTMQQQSQQPRQPWISFTSNDIVSQSHDSPERGKRTRQASITSSTAAVKSGKTGGDFFTSPSAGEDCSVSRSSYSSHSTVKISNKTMGKNNDSHTEETLEKTSGQEKDVVSLLPPKRTKSSPPKLSENNPLPVVDGEQSASRPSFRDFRSMAHAIPAIQEDVEQSSSPSQRLQTTTAKALVPSSFVPPAQLDHPVSEVSTERLPGEEFTVISALEQTDRSFSLSSFASSTVSSPLKAILGVEDKSSHISSTIASEQEDGSSPPSVMVDEAQDLEAPDRQPKKKRSIRTRWLVALFLMFGLAIILPIALLSNNSKGSKWEVGITSSPTTPDDDRQPTLSPTPFPILKNDTLDPLVPDSAPSSIEVASTQAEDGGVMHSVRWIDEIVDEGLGLSVAIGGDVRVAVLGNQGLVRVAELTFSSTGISAIPWPIPSRIPQEKAGHNSTHQVGNGIAIPTDNEHVVPRIAISENGQRLAAIVDTRLIVHEFGLERWESVVDEIPIFGAQAFSNEHYSLPSDVSASADGNVVAAGTIVSSGGIGNELLVQVWDIESERSIISTRYELDNKIPASYRRLHIELSSSGENLLICTDDAVMVKQVGDDKNPSRIFTGNIDSCALSGDGLILAISTTSGTSVGKILINQDHDRVLQELDMIPENGNALSLDYAGNLLAIAGSSSEGVTVWGAPGDGAFVYRKLEQFSERDVGVTNVTKLEQFTDRDVRGTNMTKAVALTKRSSGQEAFMAVGNPDAGIVNIYKIRTMIY